MRKRKEQAAAKSHQSALPDMGAGSAFSANLMAIHSLIKQKHSFIDRVAIAIYDAPSDKLKTFAYSSDQTSPLTQYEAKLADSPSLQSISEQRVPRIVNDMRIFTDVKKKHSEVLENSGFKSSYTFPMIYDGKFLGFIFFNSFQRDVFNDPVMTDLDMSATLITLLIENLQSTLNTLIATVKSAQAMTNKRDSETGGHLARMSRYARLIAKRLAPKYQFDDEYIEHLYLFAPLHDVGKIAIPDRILLKQGHLTDEEREIMKSHTQKGLEIIDELIHNFGLSGVKHLEMLRHIVYQHHEFRDGSGYPNELTGDRIPIESRIVTVADIFDALTSRRPYKEAWSNQDAFEELKNRAGKQLDEDCVNALLDAEPEIRDIQAHFSECAF